MARTVSPVQLEQFQLSEADHAITVTDEDGVAIDLSGKTLRLVVFDENDPPVGMFQITDANITIGGASSNIATVTVDATASATASENYRWILWSTTDDDALANGAFKIWPAVKTVP